MDDLISRTLALEVINAVKGVVWSQSGKVLCGKMYSQIKDLPAVDAVPVEWMSKFCADDIAEDQRETIEWMLKVWKRDRRRKHEHE